MIEILILIGFESIAKNECNKMLNLVYKMVELTIIWYESRIN